jgi:hypothetical protein
MTQLCVIYIGTVSKPYTYAQIVLYFIPYYLNMYPSFLFLIGKYYDTDLGLIIFPKYSKDRRKYVNNMAYYICFHLYSNRNCNI